MKQRYFEIAIVMGVFFPPVIITEWSLALQLLKKATRRGGGGEKGELRATTTAVGRSRPTGTGVELQEKNLCSVSCSLFVERRLN